MNRREFIGAALAGAALGVRAAAGEEIAAAEPRDAGNGRKWYKGMLHSHTFLSDGRALPEQAVAAYKKAGYNFFAITDHTRAISDGETWRYVQPEKGWPHSVTSEQFVNARRRFPGTLKYKLMPDGTPLVRFTPFDELQRAFDESGKFMVLEGVEVTRQLATPLVKGHVHMNYVNLSGLIPSCRGRGLIETFSGKDWDVARIIRETHEEVEKYAAAAGNPPYLLMLNHPQWTVMPVQPEHLIAEDRIRHFEVVNYGETCAAPAPVDCGGWENDRFWDIVNAFRRRQGKQLLFGVGSDDTHRYPDSGLPEEKVPSAFGHAGVVVRATELTPAAIFGAMERGDYYATDGFVTIDDIAFERGTLRVRAIADPDDTLSIRFIVSKRGFDPSFTTHTVTFASGDGAGTQRKVNVYGDTRIGQSVKLVQGKPGEPVEASYAMAEDDLYVRARVESTKTTLNRLAGRKSFCPPCRTAWTQPYC